MKRLRIERQTVCRKSTSDLSESTYPSVGIEIHVKIVLGNFPGGLVVENLPSNAGDMGSVPGPGRSHMTWSNEVCAQLPSPRT